MICLRKSAVFTPNPKGSADLNVSHCEIDKTQTLHIGLCMIKALGLADGQPYKMAGNSVSVPVISAFGAVIKTVNEKAEQERNDHNA